MDDDKNYKIAMQQANQRRSCLLGLLLLSGISVTSFFLSGTPSAIAMEQQLALRLEADLAAKVGSDLDMNNGIPDEAADMMDAAHDVESEKILQERVDELDSDVRKIKATGVIMETDPASLEATKKLQEATKELIAVRYGEEGPFRVRVVLEFQPSIPDFAEKGKDGVIMIEMAPEHLVPHSVYSFLEIARQWKSGAFHRVAPHVLQVLVRGKFPHLAFQEYSSEFPHKKGTVGYAGRPSGPAWYISIQDNSRNHGPGSQQKKNPYEADSCFGKVIEGFDDVVPRISLMNGKEPNYGFVGDNTKHVLIKELQILKPGGGILSVDGYVPWVPSPQLVAMS